MSKHNHKHEHCQHELKYCVRCDAVYCLKCDKEWNTLNFTLSSQWVNPGTWSYSMGSEGTAGFPESSPIIVTCSHEK